MRALTAATCRSVTFTASLCRSISIIKTVCVCFVGALGLIIVAAVKQRHLVEDTCHWIVISYFCRGAGRRRAGAVAGLTATSTR